MNSKSKIKIKTFAKINLALSIGNKRQDDYHEILSIVQTISIFDLVTIKKSKHSICKTNDETIPNGEQNIALKAANEFFNFTKIDEKAEIKLEKNIPSSAGLGGGSSDAAATIIGLNKLYSTKLENSDMIKIAKKIGADVPFFIYGGTCIISGIGEKVKKIKSIPNCTILIVKPKLDISTKLAYSKFDCVEKYKISKNRILNIEKIKYEIEHFKNIENIAKHFFNDFENILNNVEIHNLKLKMLECGAISAMLTGSGSAVFGVYDNEKAAKYTKKILSKENEQTSFICKPVEQSNNILDFF